MADDTTTIQSQAPTQPPPDKLILPNPPAWVKDYQDPGFVAPSTDIPTTFGDNASKQVLNNKPTPPYKPRINKPIFELTSSQKFLYHAASAVGRMFQANSMPDFLNLSESINKINSDKILSLTSTPIEPFDTKGTDKAKELKGQEGVEAKADIKDWSDVVGKNAAEGTIIKIDDYFKRYDRDYLNLLKRLNPTWTGQYLQMQKTKDGKIIPKAYNMASVFEKDPTAFGQLLRDANVYGTEKQATPIDIEKFNESSTSGVYEDIKNMTPQELDKFQSKEQEGFHVNDKLKSILQGKPELSKALMQNPELVDAFKKELVNAPEITREADQAEILAKATYKAFGMDKEINPTALYAIGNMQAIRNMEAGFTKIQGDLAAQMRVSGEAALREGGQGNLLDEYNILQSKMLSNPRAITPADQKRYAALTLQLNDAISKSGSQALGNNWLQYQANSKNFGQVIKTFPAMLEASTTKDGANGIDLMLKQQRGEYILNNLGKYFPEFEKLQATQQLLDQKGSDKLSIPKSFARGVAESAITLTKDIAHFWGDDKGVFNLMKGATEPQDDPLMMTPNRPVLTDNNTTNAINDISNFADETAHGIGGIAMPIVFSEFGGSVAELGTFAAQSHYDTYTALRKAGVDKDTAETMGLTNAFLTAATMKFAFMPSRIVRQQVERLGINEVVDAIAGKGSVSDAVMNMAGKLAPTSGDLRNAFLATVQQGAMNLADYVEKKKVGLPPASQDNMFRNIMQQGVIVGFLGGLGRLGDKSGAHMVAKRYADENPMMFATAISNAKVEALTTGRYDYARITELENDVWKHWQKTSGMPSTMTYDQKLAASHIVDNINYYRNQMKSANEDFRPYWDGKMKEMQGQLSKVVTDPNDAVSYNNKVTEPIMEHLKSLRPEEEEPKPFEGVVIRHGQTAANAQGRFNADDEGLTPQAKLDAKKLGEQLEANGITMAVTSNSKRSVETAEAMGLPHIASNMLRDWQTGSEGQPLSSFDQKYYVDHPDEKPVGGESFNDFLGRVQALRTRAATADKSVALLSHGFTMKLWETLDKNNGKWDEKSKVEFLKDSNDFDNHEMYSPAKGRMKGFDEAKKEEAKEKPQDTEIAFAPYRSRNVSTLEEDTGIREAPDYKLHQQIAGDVAEKLGIKMQSNKNTWGGYVDSETGKPVQEVSNVMHVDATGDQAELMAAILGKAAPEMQDSVLVGTYNENGSGMEYTIHTGSFDNATKALEHLKNNGLEYFTIDKDSGDIFILDMDNSLEGNVTNFAKDLQENNLYEGAEKSKADAKFVGKDDYDTIIEKNRDKARTEKGFDIDAYVQEAKGKYDKIKTDKDAIREQGATKQVLRDEGVRREGGLPPVVEGDQPKEPAGKSETQQAEKEVTPQGDSKESPLLKSIDEEAKMATGAEKDHLDKRKQVIEKYGKDIDDIIKDLKEDKRLEVNCPPGTKRKFSLRSLIGAK